LIVLIINRSLRIKADQLWFRYINIIDFERLLVVIVLPTPVVMTSKLVWNLQILILRY